MPCCRRRRCAGSVSSFRDGIRPAFKGFRLSRNFSLFFLNFSLKFIPKPASKRADVIDKQN